ncbi:MAG: transcriptional regulator GcvA [Hyphomicrobiaceae bacterium]
MSRKLPPLNALRAFEAAARHASFTKAAAELNVTHAAVSRHIRELEERLGLALFERTGRGVVLTRGGAQYGRALTPLFDRLDEVTRSLIDDQEAPALFVTVEEAFASWWLIARLGRFTERHPEIELALDPTDRVVDFHGERVDLGIRYGRGDWRDVRAEHLVTLQMFPVCCPDLLAETGIRAPADLDRTTLLHEAKKEYWADWLAVAGAERVDWQAGPVFRGYLALSAAATGQGFALGDQVVAGDDLLEGTLVKPFAPMVEIGGYYLVRAKGRAETPAMRAFRIWLGEELEKSLTAVAPFLAGAPA